MRFTTAHWVLISAMIALITLVIGGVLSYQSRDFTWETFQISSLQSAYTNPLGYLIPSVGTLFSQLILIYVAIKLARRFNDLYAGVFLVTSLALMSVNSVHDIINMKNWMVHAVMAHIGFGLMILSHIMYVFRARAWQDEHVVDLRRRYHIDQRWAVFSFAVVMLLFIIPKFTGFDVMKLIFDFNVDYILGACEVIYLVVFYVSMYRVAACESRPEMNDASTI